MKADITLQIRWDEVAKVHVGYCPEWDVYSQGCTKEDAALATLSAVDMLELYKKSRLARPAESGTR